jgi:hypothetical protein
MDRRPPHVTTARGWCSRKAAARLREAHRGYRCYVSRLDSFWYESGVYFGLRDEDPEKAKAREAATQDWERPSFVRLAVGLAILFAGVFLWRTLDGGDARLGSVAWLAARLLVFAALVNGAMWLIQRGRR